MSKKVSSDGVKAVLHGGGGDELCFGYDTYNASLISYNSSLVNSLIYNFLKMVKPFVSESKQKVDLKYKFNKFIEVLKSQSKHGIIFGDQFLTMKNGLN